jgi:hypothetical protein
MSNQAVLPVLNMFPFSNLISFPMRTVVDSYQKIYYGDKDLCSIFEKTDQFSFQQSLLGGLFYPETVSRHGPFTLEEALQTLDSNQCFYPQSCYRPGSLIEFHFYVSQGGKFGANVLIVGDINCGEIFQLVHLNFGYCLLVISKTEAMKSIKLDSDVGIFVALQSNQ